MSSNERIWKLIHAKRAATIAVGILLGILVLYGIGFSHPFMALIPVIIIPLMFPNEIVEFSGQRFLGALVATMLGFVILHTTTDLFFGFILCFGTLVLIGLYVVSQIVHYGSMMAMITFSVVYYFIFFSPYDAIDFGLAWVIGICIGVTILRFVHYFLWPSELKGCIKGSLSEFKEKVLRLLEGKSQRLGFDFNDLLATQSMINSYKGDHSEENEHLKVIRDLRLKVTHAVELSNKVQGEYAEKLMEVRREFAENLRRDDFLIHKDTMVTKALKSLEKEIYIDLRQEECSSLHAADRSRVLASLSQLRKAYKNIANYKNLMNLDAEAKHVNVPIFTMGKILRAIRMALPITLCIMAGIYFNLPGGLQAVISAIVIILQPNDGRAAKQAYLRLLGVFLGMTVGVVFCYICLSLQSYIFFAFFFSACIYFFSYMAFRIPKYAYVFIQANLAFLILFTFSSFNEFQIQTLVQRFVGVISGFLITSVVIVAWPLQDPWKLLKKNMLNIYEMLANKSKALAVGECTGMLTFISNATQILELRQDVNHFSSRHAYEKCGMEHFYLQLESIFLEAKNLVDVTSSKVIKEEMGEVLEKLSAFFLEISQQIWHSDTFNFKSEANQFIDELDSLCLRFNEAQIVRKYTVHELEEVLDLLSIIRNLLMRTGDINLHTDQYEPEGKYVIAKPV